MKFNQSFHTIDTQVVGQAFRIVTQSPIMIAEQSIDEAANMLSQHFEIPKKLLLSEPRGHRGMNGCIVLPSKEATFRLLFFQHEASQSFKYEAIIASVTALIEQNTVQANEQQLVTIETTEGLITAKIELSEGGNTVSAVQLQLAKAVIESDVAIVDSKRKYAIVEKPAGISAIQLDELSSISTWGIEESVKIIDADGVIMYEKLDTHLRTVTFEKDGYVLRSPGVDTTLAMAAFLGEPNELINESIFGSSIKIRANQKDGYELALKSYITGIHQFVVDQEDPLQEGFVII